MVKKLTALRLLVVMRLSFLAGRDSSSETSVASESAKI